jgi:hypothetical protein
MSVKEQIRLLSSKYAEALDKKIQERVLEMKEDDTSHFLLYKVLGVSETDGELIDISLQICRCFFGRSSFSLF